MENNLEEETRLSAYGSSVELLDSNNLSEKGAEDLKKMIYGEIYSYQKKSAIMRDRGVSPRGIIIEGKEGNYREEICRYICHLLGKKPIKLDSYDFMKEEGKDEIDRLINILREGVADSIIISSLGKIEGRTNWEEKYYKTMDEISREKDWEVFCTVENVDKITNKSILRMGLQKINVDNITEREKNSIVEKYFKGEEIDEKVRGKILDMMSGMERQSMKAFCRNLLYNSIEDDTGKTVITEEILEETHKEISKLLSDDINLIKPDERYSDVGGLEKEKERIKNVIEIGFKQEQKLDNFGIDTPKGILLYGPPGTGKTLLAKAVAGSSKANMIEFRCSDIMQKYLGESESKIANMFEIARKNKPCIIFLDEFDAIGKQRKQNKNLNSTATSQRVVSQLLSEMDGMQSEDGVKIVASTNRPSKIDRALLRSGRIGEKIEIPLPSKEAREEIFRIHLSQKPKKESIDISHLAEITENFSGGDIERVCNLAGMKTIKRNQEKIDEDTIKEAIKENKDKVEEQKEYYEKEKTSFEKMYQ